MTRTSCAQCCQLSLPRRSEQSRIGRHVYYVLLTKVCMRVVSTHYLLFTFSIFFPSVFLYTSLVDPAFPIFTSTQTIKMGKIQFFAVVILSLVATNWAAVQIDRNLQNKNVDCSIDLTTQLVKTSCKVTVAKTDSTGATYTFYITPEQSEKLAYISVRDAHKKELKTVEERVPEGVAYTVTLNSASPTPVLTIETVLTKCLQPYPTHITQSERQLVRYFGNAYFYSPYKTLTQKTTVQLASKSVESYTTVKPSSQSDTVITYGPYENVAGE